MKHLLFCTLALIVSACGRIELPPETETDTFVDETTTTSASSSTPTTTPTESSSGTTTSTTSAWGTPCPSPLLGWDPQGATDIEPFTGTMAYAASLPPFGVNTVCQKVLVGLYIDEGSCGSPTSVDVFSSSEPATAPPPGVTPLPSTYMLDGAQAVQVLTPKASVYHLARTMHFAAGEHPFVGMKTDNACAVGGFPSCEPARAWRHDGFATWHTLLDDTGAEDQLFFGLADCAPEAP